MKIHNLKRIHPNKRSVSIGRGGRRGKPSGRGGKGQTARAGHKVRPEFRDVIKKLPKLRGRGKHGLKSFQRKYIPLSIETVAGVFKDNENLNPKTLLEKGLVGTSSGVTGRAKLLGS